MRVISMDIRGHGRSGKPHDAARYGHHLMDDLTRLLDHLELERAHVAGYSLGGFIALKLATVRPERLLSVAVLGAGWEPPENKVFLRALPKLADDLRAGKGIGPLMEHLGDERRKPGLLHRLWVRLLTRYANDSTALMALVRSIPVLAVTEAELRSIDLAVCSIVGSRDPFIANVHAMRGKISDHTVCVVDGGDHIGTPRRPEFKAALHSFLTQRIGVGHIQSQGSDRGQ